MNRRDFLVSAAGAAGVAGLARTRIDRDVLARPDLLAILGVPSVRAIGQRYRELVPAESERGQLRAAIPLLLRAELAQLVRDDFAMGRTILVAGWVLSVTEARQCALFSLSPA